MGANVRGTHACERVVVNRVPLQPMKVLTLLKSSYPNAHYYLDFKTPLDLLVAAILSAQVRDEVVNDATKELFRHYKKAKDYANASVNDLVKYIGKVSFAANKATHIIAASKMLVDKHDGNVPKTIEELIELPGVGRKTAIVILSNAYNIVDGIVVDTHVIRVSDRLGWSHQKNADRRAQELDKLIPKEWWKETQWLLKAHGRAICKAPIPSCSRCPIGKLCPKVGVTKHE
ncbi:endonuclease III [Candidatus Woesearchaeota archaeon]|nr:endonuclease III [Candidatus Woesearchaeota archaeon]